RVIDYLANNTGNPTLAKIQNFEQLTTSDINELQRVFWEELGTREEYNEITVGKRYNNNVAAFIRVINGIDRKKALEKYTEFIKGADLSAEQEQYLKNILDYISVNGDIQVSDFMEYPLKLYRWRDVFGNQFVSLKDFVKEVHQVIEVVA
ncbi:MAG: helicase, partial [Prevotellaceae bacterium]|nr:helicase [Candidatus Minthosoma caballi]